MAGKEAMGYYVKREQNKLYWWDENIEKEIITKGNIYNEFLANKTDSTTKKFKTQKK